MQLDAEIITLLSTTIVSVVGAIAASAVKVVSEFRSLKRDINGPEGDPSLRQMVSEVADTANRNADTLTIHGRRISALEESREHRAPEMQ